ncbi:hypothetical protein ABZ914_05715 [Spirillospora sp. NPDC046719]
MTTALISGIFAIVGAFGGALLQSWNSRRTLSEQRQHEDRLRDLSYRRDLYARFANIADDAWHATWRLKHAKEWIEEAEDADDEEERKEAKKDFDASAYEHSDLILKLTSIRWEVELAAPSEVVQKVQAIQIAVAEEEAPTGYLDGAPEAIRDFVVAARKDLGLPVNSVFL